MLINQIGIKDIFNQTYDYHVLVELSSNRHNEEIKLLLKDSIAAAILDETANDALIASNET